MDGSSQSIVRVNRGTQFIARTWGDTLTGYPGVDARNDHADYNSFSRSLRNCAMSRTYDEIVSDAMKLPPGERADLADRLWVSVDTPEAVAAAWDEEIARR